MLNRLIVLYACLLGAQPALAGEVLIAVSSNFAEVAEQLGTAFHKNNDHRLTFSAGSTGTLYAQIRHGAPYDVFLSADEQRPQLLDAEGLIVPGSRFVYARGRLAFWSADFALDSAAAQQLLEQGNLRALAIANPDLAPYGLAAKQTLLNLGLWDELQPRLVFGQNIGQAHAMVATRNAEYGFVALSSIVSERNTLSRQSWIVAEHLHEPIRQQAVLLLRGQTNIAAKAFLAYLKSADARRTIEAAGFAVE